MYIREDFVLPVANPSYAQHMKGVVWRDDVDNKRRGERGRDREREIFNNVGTARTAASASILHPIYNSSPSASLSSFFFFFFFFLLPLQSSFVDALLIDAAAQPPSAHLPTKQWRENSIGRNCCGRAVECVFH